jgi:hypothetical protein
VLRIDKQSKRKNLHIGGADKPTHLNLDIITKNGNINKQTEGLLTFIVGTNLIKTTENVENVYQPFRITEIRYLKR